MMAFEMIGDNQQHLTIMQAEQGVALAERRIRPYAAGALLSPSGEIARRAAPEAMQELVRLATEAQDERVRSVCLLAVLDRAGVRPIDFDANKEKDERPKFNPRDFSPQELDVIETAMRLMLRPKRVTAEPAEPEIMEPVRVC